MTNAARGTWKIVALASVVAGCGAVGASPDATADARAADAGPPRADAGSTTVAGGDVSGTWCGQVHVAAMVRVPAGDTLTVCAGAIVEVADNAAIQVEGTLVLDGAADARITISGRGTWSGLEADGAGTLRGAFTDLSHARVAVFGDVSSTIQLTDSTITSCVTSMQLRNGGTFDRVTITGGTAAMIMGGVLRMTDSTIDLQHAGVPPDCTDFQGGGAALDHVHFTGCHCPIHIDSASLPITITGSILDGAANPVMIAHATASITGTNLIGALALVDDIDMARTSSVRCELGGNYWDRGGVHTPDVRTYDPSQFTGTDVFASAPIPGAGPR